MTKEQWDAEENRLQKRIEVALKLAKETEGNLAVSHEAEQAYQGAKADWEAFMARKARGPKLSQTSPAQRLSRTIKPSTIGAAG